MWSPRGDYERADKRAELSRQTLTPAQERQKAFRERVFNAGFDAAIRATTPAEVLRHIHFDHPKYIADRRQQFERWDLDDRVNQALKP
jgi:hypothetical protein